MQKPSEMYARVEQLQKEGVSTAEAVSIALKEYGAKVKPINTEPKIRNGVSPSVDLRRILNAHKAKLIDKGIILS